MAISRSVIKHISMAKLAIKLFLVITGAVLAMLILEVYQRLNQSSYHIPIECYRMDDILNHTLIPQKTCQFKTSEWNISYKINSLGLRDKERSLEKPANTFRILMLGDSFTEGWGINQDKTFGAILEKRLNETSKSLNFEVINAGVSAYSPILEYLYLKNKGLNFKPDLVILNFDPNDFADDQGFAQFAKFDQDGIPLAVSPKLPEVYRLGQEISNKLNEHELVLGDLKPNPIYYFLAKHSFLLRQVLFTQLIRPNVPTTEATSIQWAQTGKNLLLTKALLEKANIQFLVTIYPYQIHLKNPSLNTFSKLSEFGRENNLKVLNLFGDFAKDKPQSYYFKRDIHGNEKFHNTVAQSIYRYLVQNKLVAD